MTSLILPNNWRPRRYQTPLWKYLQDGGKRAPEPHANDGERMWAVIPLQHIDDVRFGCHDVFNLSDRLLKFITSLPNPSMCAP